MVLNNELKRIAKLQKFKYKKASCVVFFSSLIV